LADYVYFNHSAHISGGVGCATCHGPVQQMDTVRTVQPLNMAWCVSCHRDPTSFLRPRDQVTNMDWTPPPTTSSTAAASFGHELAEKYHTNPSTDCVTCHR